jgi:hypothetical protein
VGRQGGAERHGAAERGGRYCEPALTVLSDMCVSHVQY